MLFDSGICGIQIKTYLFHLEWLKENTPISSAVIDVSTVFFFNTQAILTCVFVCGTHMLRMYAIIAGKACAAFASGSPLCGVSVFTLKAEKLPKVGRIPTTRVHS